MLPGLAGIGVTWICRDWCYQDLQELVLPGLAGIGVTRLIRGWHNPGVTEGGVHFVQETLTCALDGPFTVAWVGVKLCQVRLG